MSPNIDGKVTNVKKSATFHHLHWSFHCVQFEATAWTGGIFPLLTTAIKRQEVRSIPSFRTWAIHHQFGLLRVLNKANLRVTFNLFGRMASVVTEHNFAAQISPVWLTLAFSLVEMRPFFSWSLFSILVWCNLIFRPIFFKPKLKLVRNAIRPLYMRFRATVRVLIIKVALNLMPTSSLTVQEEVLMSDFLDQRKIVLWKLFLALTNNYLKGAFYQPIGPNRLNRWQKLFSYDVKPVNYHERKFARLPTVSGFSLHIIPHSFLSILTWPSFVSL